MANKLYNNTTTQLKSKQGGKIEKNICTFNTDSIQFYFFSFGAAAASATSESALSTNIENTIEEVYEFLNSLISRFKGISSIALLALIGKIFGAAKGKKNKDVYSNKKTSSIERAAKLKRDAATNDQRKAEIIKEIELLKRRYERRELSPEEYSEKRERLLEKYSAN